MYNIKMQHRNKSQYKLQKEFEEEVLCGKIEEIKEFLYYQDVSPFKNKSQAIYNAIERGSITIFNMLLNNRKLKDNNINLTKVFEIILKKNDVTFMRYLLKYYPKKNFDYYMIQQFKQNNYIKNPFLIAMHQETIGIEMVELITSLKLLHYSLISSELKYMILKLIVKENRSDLFEKLIIKYVEYNSTLKTDIINFLIKEEKIIFLKKYISLIETENELTFILEKIHNKSDIDLVTNFKNKNIKLKDLNLLKIMINSNKYSLIKNIYNRKTITLEKKEEALKEIIYTKNKNYKKVFNLFIIDKEIDLDKYAKSLVSSCVNIQNIEILKIILKNTSIENFDNYTLSMAVFNNELIDILIEDRRFKEDTEDLKAVKMSIKYDKIESLKKIMTLKSVVEKIDWKFLNSLYENKNYEALKVIVHNIEESKLANFENLKEEIKVMFNVRNF
jgi:hypothetical protein